MGDSFLLQSDNRRIADRATDLWYTGSTPPKVPSSVRQQVPRITQDRYVSQSLSDSWAHKNIHQGARPLAALSGRFLDASVPDGEFNSHTVNKEDKPESMIGSTKEPNWFQTVYPEIARVSEKVEKPLAFLWSYSTDRIYPANLLKFYKSGDDYLSTANRFVLTPNFFAGIRGSFNPFFISAYGNYYDVVVKKGESPIEAHVRVNEDIADTDYSSYTSQRDFITRQQFTQNIAIRPKKDETVGWNDFSISASILENIAFGFSIRGGYYRGFYKPEHYQSPEDMFRKEVDILLANGENYHHKSDELARRTNDTYLNMGFAFGQNLIGSQLSLSLEGTHLNLEEDQIALNPNPGGYLSFSKEEKYHEGPQWIPWIRYTVSQGGF